MTTLVHLSDLHLTTIPQAETVLGQLRSDLVGELRLGTVDGLIVSGDSTERAQEPEYDSAAWFLLNLMELLSLSPENVLLVPGNHDVDWAAARASYEVLRVGEAPASSVSQYQDPANRDYVEVVVDPGRYQRRFQNYAHYHELVTGRRYSLDYAGQYEVLTTADKGALLIGLNSAWNLDHYYPVRTSIEASALNGALSEATRQMISIDPSPRAIAVWHHPAHDDGALRDTSFFQRLVVDDVVAVLHGHIHKARSEQFNYEWSSQGRRLWLLGAGTLDSPDPTRGYPWHYGIAALDGDTLEVRSRGKSERSGAWHADAQYLMGRGQSPTDVLRLPLRSYNERERSVETKAGPLRTMSELKTELQRRGYDAVGYRIAVEALIFDPNGRVLLQKRGSECRDEIDKYECVGGQVFGEDLIAATSERVCAVVGDDVRIEIDELLDVQPARFVERHGPEDWIVVAYLCRLREGTPAPVDAAKTAELRWFDLAELHALDDVLLSRSTSRQRDVYRARFRTKPYFSRVGRLA